MSKIFDRISTLIADWGLTNIFVLLIGMIFKLPLTIREGTGIWLLSWFVSFLYCTRITIYNKE